MGTLAGIEHAINTVAATPRKAGGQPVKLLDLGSGSGLLSLLACQRAQKQGIKVEAMRCS